MHIYTTLRETLKMISALKIHTNTEMHSIISLKTTKCINLLGRNIYRQSITYSNLIRNIFHNRKILISIN